MKILALLFAIVFYFGFVLHTTFSTPSKSKAKLQNDLGYVSAQPSTPQIVVL